MMKFILDKNLRTGIIWQDRQHEELFKRVDAFISAVKNGKGKVEAIRLLDFLDDYVVTHFHAEEMAMGEHDYPQALSHIEKHTFFIEDIARLKKELEKIPTEKLIDEVTQKVKDWLINHIAIEDKALGSFLIKKGAGAPPGI